MGVIHIYIYIYIYMYTYMYTYTHVCVCGGGVPQELYRATLQLTWRQVARVPGLAARVRLFGSNA